MEDIQASVGNTGPASLLLRTLGRVVLFGLAGASFFAIVGAVIGTLIETGALLLLDSSQFMNLAPVDIIWGASCAAIVGGIAGTIAFVAVGVMASFVPDTDAVWRFALRRAMRGLAIGVVLGGIVGIVNGLLVPQVLLQSYLSDLGFIGPDKEVAWMGFWAGAGLGLFIGVLYFAITGARTEVRRQRIGQMQSA